MVMYPSFSHSKIFDESISLSAVTPFAPHFPDTSKVGIPNLTRTGNGTFEPGRPEELWDPEEWSIQWIAWIQMDTT
jgi:hypothetical protein